MFIASVSLKNKSNDIIYDYKIVTDKSKENHSCRPAILYYEDDLADKIMEACAKGKNIFKFGKEYGKDREFEIVKIIKNEIFDKYNKHSRKRVNFSRANPIKIHLYKTSATCPKCKRAHRGSNLENVIATVPCLRSKNESREIEIQYCRYCDYYFADAQSIQLYEKRYGILIYERLYDFIDDESMKSDEFILFNRDSILSRYGYTAQVGKLTENQRRGILILLIENGYKNQVKDLLSKFINYRSDRCYRAKFIWRSDLDFVNHYNMGTERYVGDGSIDYKNVRYKKSYSTNNESYEL